MIAIFGDKIFWMWLSLAFFVSGLLLGLTGKKWDVSALTFTAAILVWYSAETRQLRLETREANRLSVLPGLTLRYIRSGENEDGDWMLILSNVGKGVALNPEILVLNSPQSTLSFNLQGVNAIYPGHVIRASLDASDRSNTQDTFMRLADRPLKVKIQFSSALDPRGLLFTEQEIEGPPDVKIVETSWL